MYVARGDFHMTPRVLSAFGHELAKIADSQVIQNHPDDGLARGVLGAGAVGLAGAAGNFAGNFANRKFNDLLYNQNTALANLKGDQSLAEMWSRVNEAKGGTLRPRNPNIPNHDTGYLATPAEDQMFRKLLDENKVQLFTEAASVPGGGVTTGQSSYYHPGLPSQNIPKHVYLDMVGGQVPHVMAHEVGHMTGWQGLHKLPLHKLQNAGKIAPIAIGTLGAYEALSSEKRTPEERDKFLKKIRNLSLAGGALALPNIAEEARASIRAVNMGRKVGRGAEYAKHLLPAFGTYVAGPLGAAAGAALGVEGLRRYLKSRGTKTQAEEQ